MGLFALDWVSCLHFHGNDLGQLVNHKGIIFDYFQDHAFKYVTLKLGCTSSDSFKDRFVFNGA